MVYSVPYYYVLCVTYLVVLVVIVQYKWELHPPTDVEYGFRMW